MILHEVFVFVNTFEVNVLGMLKVLPVPKHIITNAYVQS